MTKGSVLASGANFPFPDGLMTAVETGSTAAIQPGGSIRDDKAIAEADEAGMSMVFSGMRRLRHEDQNALLAGYVGRAQPIRIYLFGCAHRLSGPFAVFHCAVNPGFSMH